MPDRSNYDMEFRPASYWGVSEAVLANVMGEFRRRQIHEAMEEGTVNTIPTPIFGESPPDAVVVPTSSRYRGGVFLSKANISGDTPCHRVRRKRWPRLGLVTLQPADADWYHVAPV